MFQQVDQSDRPVSAFCDRCAGPVPVLPPVELRSYEDADCGGCQLAVQLRRQGTSGAGCADHEAPPWPGTGVETFTLRSKAADLPAELRSALLESGMRATACAACGCEMLTRTPAVDGKDYCPPHEPKADPITPGDVVQVDPRRMDLAFAGCLLVVEKLVGTEGLQGYVMVPTARGELPGRASLRLPLADVQKIGRAHWVSVSTRPIVEGDG